ncbi:pyridoxamine 5'-phosphate oxidase family protein [Novosphingobium pentaromativorans]|uniref:Pyridoxamine 5'-phosphate oxidase-related protein, FMN-binding n=1 Tax=Novosphingobium pentaromativorans US6-1 TaxID=1088721 RepID=G6EFU0_9SPHN|nr:pyridoxamine 5'-phosphate oxidase family protein [Novosphingobium pentaromativorans]AIT81798.1 pyridoxamine 5'-phosphate oxidase [Novosphingobium pentaromativorans US6-1]EHJ59868.1 pyridoxamine 5'-phosphate oxidase-related protein, FMN-binding [Novosphingobium pentaromativorans US6-1]
MPSSDVAFTASVKAMQQARGSREAYARIEQRGGFRTGINDDLADFLTRIDTAYLATASAGSQPYAQHRGGPPGFIRVIDARTLGFADFVGNRQYVTAGNLAENEQAFLFLMDYGARRRIKIWGLARVVADDPELVARLMPQGYPARAEQAILFTVLAWDVNCPQHIPRKLDADDVTIAITSLEARIATLETENAELRAQIERTKP